MSNYDFRINQLKKSLASAIKKDERSAQKDLDVSKGIFGKNVDEWIYDVAKNIEVLDACVDALV